MAHSSSSSSVSDILSEAALTYKERNAQYKDNWRLFGNVMVGLFPQGLVVKTYADWTRLQFLMLKMVKMTRYAENFREGHRDSIHDDMVYSAMLEAIDLELKRHEENDRRANVGSNAPEPPGEWPDGLDDGLA